MAVCACAKCGKETIVNCSNCGWWKFVQEGYYYDYEKVGYGLVLAGAQLKYRTVCANCGIEVCIPYCGGSECLTEIERERVQAIRDRKLEIEYKERAEKAAQESKLEKEKQIQTSLALGNAFLKRWRSARDKESYKRVIEQFTYVSRENFSAMKCALDTMYKENAEETSSILLELVSIFYKGKGIIKKNQYIAYDLIWYAARSGDGAAQRELGLMYCKGKKVDKDCNTGVALLAHAALVRVTDHEQGFMADVKYPKKADETAKHEYERYIKKLRKTKNR